MRFGDAILISIPEAQAGETTRFRHILIDVGNSTSSQGGINQVFLSVVEDILKELDGQPLDLYVMTHEHMDHVQGLPFASDNLGLDEPLKQKLNVQQAWLTVSADPDYSSQYPDAQEKKIQALDMLNEIDKFMGAAQEDSGTQPSVPPWVKGLLAINSNKTEECVEYLRSLVPDPRYVHRQTDLSSMLPFQSARLELWAPEADTSIYYGRFQPLALVGSSRKSSAKDASWPNLLPPAGVDASTFYNLVEIRQTAYADNLLAIDKAANNTSLVLCLEWGGFRLLFPGDAELRSWKEMDNRGLLKPVDFLKVGHHGSHNATPPPDLLDKILPEDGKRRYAAVSTYPAEDSPVEDFVS